MVTGKALVQPHRVSLNERRESVGDPQESKVDEVCKTHFVF